MIYGKTTQDGAEYFSTRWHEPTGIDLRLLPQMVRQQGLDAATRRLYEMLHASPRHAPLIRDIERRMAAPFPGRQLDALLAVAPGLFYDRLPKTGADGRLIRQEAERIGCRTELIPTGGSATAQQNGRCICDWLLRQSHERIILASLSKGGADVVAALNLPDAERAFAGVAAWLNVSGVIDGLPIVSWLKQRPVRRWVYRALFRCRKLDFDALTGLPWRPRREEQRWFNDRAPIPLISVVGFPRCQDMSNGLLRRNHQRLSVWGPNDGVVCLADTCLLPGYVYPVWAADHNLRRPGGIRPLIAALAACLADSLGLWR